MADSIFDKAVVIREFADRYPFALDDFQYEAIAALANGRSVMVAAPTGTGKTVVAEFAVYLARLRGRRVMYTTPIKALSNQKFRDFRTVYGDTVGLLTGDVVENREGQILVMTTEVLRNMMLQTPKELDDVGVVIFDEVHYIADPERGTTWEESIVLAPPHLQLVCLSATVSNATEIASWITKVHQPIQLVEHQARAVPLLHYYYLDNELNMVLDEERRLIADYPHVGGEARRRLRPSYTINEDDRPAPATRPEPDPIEIVQSLRRAEMLPAIYFLFSRRDCEAAAEVCAMMRLRLVQEPEMLRQIGRIVERHVSRLSPEDRQLEQVKTVVRLAHRGLGFHHAGLLPVLKQLVEELFGAGLMGVVFATDTLALGINMPARTVIVGRMSKFDGQSRRPLIPNEFQQMAGRAGRRGIDDKGYVVIPYSPWMPFREALNIAIGPLYPVLSGFTLRYNTVLNLWDPPAGNRVLQMQRDSLMQFQMADHTRELANQVDEQQRKIDTASRGCLIGHEQGEALLAEYDASDQARAKMRRDRSRLARDKERMAEQTNGKPWPRPTRDELRRAFRWMPAGSVVHDEQEGWGIYLGKGSGRGAGVFLFGERLIQVDNYHRIDYLPAPAKAVALPSSMQTITGADQAADFKLAMEDRQHIESEIARLALPNLTAQVAEYRAQVSGDLAADMTRVGEELAKVEHELREEQERIDNHVCEACPVRKQHRRNLRELAKLVEQKAEAEQELRSYVTKEDRRAQRVLQGIVSVLHQFGYLRHGQPTGKAAQLANIFDANGLLICEAISAGWLHDLSAEDLAEVFSWFAYDRDLEFANRFMLPHQLVRLRRELDVLQASIVGAERRNEVVLTLGYNFYFFGMARAWCRGATLSEILSKVDLGEGDLVMTFNKTIDLVRQVEEMLGKVASGDQLREKLRRAQRLMRRGIIEQSLALGAAPAVAGGLPAEPSALPPQMGQSEAEAAESTSSRVADHQRAPQHQIPRLRARPFGQRGPQPSGGHRLRRRPRS